MRNYSMGDIILSEDESRLLISNLRNPDQSYVEMRNKLFDETDRSMSIRTEGTDFVVDIPDLDLSAIMDDETVSATVERDEDASYVSTIMPVAMPSAQFTVSYSFELQYNNDYSAYELTASTYMYEKKEDEQKAIADMNYSVAA